MTATDLATSCHGLSHRLVVILIAKIEFASSTWVFVRGVNNPKMLILGKRSYEAKINLYSCNEMRRKTLKYI